ncbi:PREDICTED: uncharacterized protein LOC105150097 [Acromyrmex echinatior]|uniref:uncharacterized protein LOC105150097 n=1 Tax=Acromyrmex echinatior TaxID=103372 RepID=UPI000580F4EB|nr:PREDICTED: uncharacterized protein LOC105150097 [Acromyrmex echinatior]
MTFMTNIIQDILNNIQEVLIVDWTPWMVCGLSPCSHPLLMLKFRKSCRLLHQGEELIYGRTQRRQRKRTYEDDEEFEDYSSGQDFLHRRNDSPVLFNCKTKRSRVSKRELESDLSDESECNSDVSQKRVFRAKKSLHREPKRKEMCAKSKGKSASRTRSPQLLQRTVQARQHSTEETENDKQRCDENHEFTEHNITRPEVQKYIERVHESNNSNSGSILENSRD